MRYGILSSDLIQGADAGTALKSGAAARLALFSFVIAMAVFAFLAMPRCAYSADVTLAWNANTESDLAGYKVYYGTASRQYGTPISIGKVVTYTVTGLAPGTYYFAITAYNTSGTESGYSNEVSTTVTDAGGDAVIPVISISTPTSSGTYTAGSASLSIGGAASDNVGVTQVTWTSSGGASGTATGTASWSVASIPLVAGMNTITVTARDAAGNIARAILNVTYTPPDTIAPAVAISSPASSGTYTTKTSTLNMSGTASDNVGVTRVTWANSAGGSGTATGTTSWSIAGITLASGTNTITITGTDAAGNRGTAVLSVNYDGTVPSIAITAPTTLGTYTAGSASMSLSGTASDNVGVTQVTWANSGGGSGTATGTTSWSVSSIALASGTNTVTVTARDAVGNATTATLVVTYSPDTTAPAVTISSPTTSGTYTATASTLSMRGTASDAVGVTEVTWTNSGGGSGTATGTTSWSIAGITLASGANTITVTGKDAAGNRGTATLLVNYDGTVPVIAITSPTTSGTYTANTASLNVSGTASDNVGVAQVTWTNSGGGSGTATGTTSWSIAGVTLVSGVNTITVTAKDAAGNAATATLAVTYTSDSTAPAISISSPTTSGTYTATASTLSMRGTASDAVGVTEVTWANSGGGSGTATGTTSWSIAGIALVSGVNTITVTAKDAAGNAATATLVVTYASDSTAPAISISSPTTSATYATNASTLSMRGTASDAVGVTEVTWANSGGGSGTATGTTSWSIAGITLASGTNTITVTGKDAAGNRGTAQLTITLDARAPVISSVTTPTVRNSSVTITWSTDESSDSQVEWGTTTSYGSATALNSTMTLSHSQELGSLAANTTYHYRVKSRDQAGNLATSPDYTFKTSGAADIAAGLVAAYGFDEGTGSKTADASGNGRTATLYYTSWSSNARFGKALYFSGRGSYATASYPGLPATNEPQTISYWWYTTLKIYDTESVVTLFSSSPRAAVQAGFKDALIGAQQDGNVWLIAGVQPATRKWHHLVYTYDGRTHSLYLDGSLLGTSTIAPAAASPTLFIIGRGSSRSQYFRGYLDELRIYNRALSLQEVQALMTLSISGK